MDNKILTAGEIFTANGVNYTAGDSGATLTLDDDGNVSGISAGSIVATLADSSSPAITFDGSTAFSFACTAVDGALNVQAHGTSINFTGGNVTYSADGISAAGTEFIITHGDGDGSLNFIIKNGDATIFSGNIKLDGALTFDGENRALGLTDGSTATVTFGVYTVTATANGDAASTITLTSDGLTLTPNEGDGSLDFTIKNGDATIFSGNIELSGSIVLDPSTHAVSVTKGTTTSITIGTRTISITATDDAGFTLTPTDDKFIITHGEGDGSLDFTIKNGDATIFSGNIELSGSIVLDPSTHAVSVTKGTTTSITIGTRTISITATDDAGFTLTPTDGKFTITAGDGDGSLNFIIKNGDATIFSGNIKLDGALTFDGENRALGLTDGSTATVTFGVYTVTITANGDAASAITLTSDGLTLTPNEGDGTLDITLASSSGSMNANFKILSGSLSFGMNNAISVAKDTELQIDFGGGYVVKFTATDDAGGSIALGTDGITFAPNSDDGGLQLSVTKGGETRSASLDVTGSVTYKLDGSISLAKDTVVRNVFDDGNILTITANSDASGSIIFTPQSGLTITPATADALTVTLTTDDLDVATVTSITGSINYSGGIITASDGTSALLNVYATWQTQLSTTGGSASIQFTADRTVYTANDDATFVLDYLDGSTLEIQHGSFTDIYATDNADAIELISEGSIFRANDEEFLFTLEDAGNYTLNGISVTAAANSTVRLLDYDTVIVDAVTYKALDDNAALSITDDGSSVTGGNVTVGLTDIDATLTVDATNGALAYDATSKKFSCAAGTIIYVASGDDASLTATITQAATDALELTDDGLKAADIGAFNLVTTSATSTRTASASLSGEILFGNDGAISLGDGTVLDLNWTDGTELKLTSHGSTGSLEFGDNGLHITAADENLDIELTTAYGYSTTVSGIKGSLWYNAGKVTLDDGTTLTGTGSIGGQAVDVTLTASDGDAYLDFSATNGFVYGAGTGSLKVTFSAGDAASTVTVNDGSMLIGTSIFTLAKGTDICYTCTQKGADLYGLRIWRSEIQRFRHLCRHGQQQRHANHQRHQPAAVARIVSGSRGRPPQVRAHAREHVATERQSRRRAETHICSGGGTQWLILSKRLKRAR